ncbi:hypothetical protein [Moorena producens]|uniref:hypothetical protein n=1 Tax=Moorena producens TaxID=1155739 RepID=UPI0011EA60DF|nr:hypothetical protein [Moorena producens]
MDMLVEWASWVELASCQFHACGTGILPVSCLLCILPVSCLLWNWHLASFMLIFERASCPLYSYSFKD